MRTLALLTLSILLAATLVATPVATANPLDIQTGPCPEGEGMTMDVNGHRVQDCQPPIIWHCDGGVQVAGQCVQLGAASLDGSDRPFPVEACGGRGELAVMVVDPLAPTPCIRIVRILVCPDGSNVEVTVLGGTRIGNCPPCCINPPRATSGFENPIQQCDELAYQIDLGPASTRCIKLVEVYYCPGGGGYLVVAGHIQTGACRPCCEPTGTLGSVPTSSDHSWPVERCEGPGGLALRFNEPLPPSECTLVLRAQPCSDGTYELTVFRLVTVGECPPCCPGSTTEAANPIELRARCNAHYPSWQLYLSGKATGPCVFLVPPPQDASSDAPPEVEVRPCVPRGVRVYVNDSPVTPCIGTNGPPVVVNDRCNHPDNGVQIIVLNVLKTACIPLPHGV